jgi:hypothetical protein
MIDGTPRGARRAALVLHGLNPPDRRWLLARLGAAERRQLQALIEELDALGVDVEAADMAALTAESSPPAPEPAPDWSSWLSDEPAWLRELLVGGGADLAPATRRALHEAATRHRPSVGRTVAGPPPEGPR